MILNLLDNIFTYLDGKMDDENSPKGSLTSLCGDRSRDLVVGQGSSGGQNSSHNSGGTSSGVGNGGSLSKKQRKARTAFTDHQLQTLEKSFERQKYLSVQDRMELAAKLGLSDTQVKTWYQNRRLVIVFIAQYKIFIFSIIMFKSIIYFI